MSLDEHLLGTIFFPYFFFHFILEVRVALAFINWETFRITPILYSTVVIRVRSEGSAQKNAQIPFPSIKMKSQYVKHLFIEDVTEDDVVAHLEYCTGIESLSLPTKSISPELLRLPIFHSDSLRRLSAPLKKLFGSPEYFIRFITNGDPQRHCPDLAPPPNPFTHLTHLHIIDPCYRWEDWSGLTLLPNLTHLALPSTSSMGTMIYLTRYCPVLEILVIMEDQEEGLDLLQVGEAGYHYLDPESGIVARSWDLNGYLVDDGRVVRCFVRKADLNWKNQAYNAEKLDFWEIAMELVERNMRGKQVEYSNPAL